jgi:hypothetical protein
MSDVTMKNIDSVNNIVFSFDVVLNQFREVPGTDITVQYLTFLPPW